MAGTRGEGSVASLHLGVSSNKYVNLFCVGFTLMTEVLHRLLLQIPSSWRSQLWLTCVVSEGTQVFWLQQPWLLARFYQIISKQRISYNYSDCTGVLCLPSEFLQKGFRNHKWFFILDLWIGSTISFYCSLTNIDNSPDSMDSLCPRPRHGLNYL